MRLARNLVGIMLLTVASGVMAHAAQESAAPPAVVLSPEQMEDFLLNGEILRMREIGEGVTHALRATLSDGVSTHDAQVQTVDETRTFYLDDVHFTDTYRYNIGAYQLALLLGIDNVPMSVERRVDRMSASVTWWIDDVMMDEKAKQETGARDPDPQRAGDYDYRLRLFDVLIDNRDRNLGNVLYTTDWTMWMIDHTRAFRLEHDLREPDRLVRVERALFENLKKLTADALAEAVGTNLTRDEVDAVIARRDAIVALFVEKIAARGEGAVLYPLPQ